MKSDNKETYKDIISRCWSILLPYVRFLLLVFLSLTLSLSWSNLFWDGVMAASPPSVEEQQGREWYQQGQVNEAITTWLKTAQDYQQQGDIISQGRVLSYLALAYSQLGNWEAADISINQSLQLLQSQREDSETIPVLAEALNIQGTLFLAKGNPLAALSSWETATETYQKVGETSGILRSQINQARALQALGLYQQACQKLVDNLTSNSLKCDDLTIDKVTALLSNDFTPLQQAGWLSLAQILSQQGNLDSSEEILNQILSQVYSPSNKASILFNLAQNLELQAELERSQKTYQQAITIATNIETKLKAQLAQLNLLIKQKSWQEVESLWINIDNNLSQLPLNQTKVDGQIYLANLLLQWSNLANSDNTLPSWQKIKILLEKAQENSQSINYETGMIYAFGDLGNLYEKLALNKTCKGSFSESIDCSNNYQFYDINQLTLSSQQLQEKAQRLTEQALIKSQAVQIPNTTYNLQWQLGRILKSLGRKTEAISTYLEAIRNLNNLTVDLVTDREVQFSFQEKVKPIYMELLSLLLPQNNQELVSQENLEEARKQIEALQVAELNNFFQDICIDSQPVDVSKIDPSAAIIYPFILRDRLVVLVSLPNKPLQVNVTKITQNELEKTVKQFRYNIVIRSQRKFFAPGKLLHEWLVKPFLEQLQEANIKTLVFVPDGVFMNVPMSALYDGQKYLIETYQVASNPGLTLLSPKAIQNQGLNTIFSGLTKTFQKEGLVPLLYVQQELKAIQSKVPNTVLLNEEFTLDNLRSILKNQSFSIVHFATHGQFSSQFDQTFLLAWNSYINVLELERLLKENDPRGTNPIELLILSACETASGDSRAALGLAGFAVRAGARSTLATLWSVNDQASAVIMEQFYEQLSTNKLSKAEALRKAQLTMLKSRWYKHPFYWSAYTLLGNWL